MTKSASTAGAGKTAAPAAVAPVAAPATNAAAPAAATAPAAAAADVATAPAADAAAGTVPKKGKPQVLSERRYPDGRHVRVLMDDKRVWKEGAE